MLQSGTDYHFSDTYVLLVLLLLLGTMHPSHRTQRATAFFRYHERRRRYPALYGTTADLLDWVVSLDLGLPINLTPLRDRARIRTMRLPLLNEQGHRIATPAAIMQMVDAAERKEAAAEAVRIAEWRNHPVLKQQQMLHGYQAEVTDVQLLPIPVEQRPASGLAYLPIRQGRVHGILHYNLGDVIMYVYMGKAHGVGNVMGTVRR